MFLHEMIERDAVPHPVDPPPADELPQYELLVEQCFARWKDVLTASLERDEMNFPGEGKLTLQDYIDFWSYDDGDGDGPRLHCDLEPRGLRFPLHQAWRVRPTNTYGEQFRLQQVWLDPDTLEIANLAFHFTHLGASDDSSRIAFDVICVGKEVTGRRIKGTEDKQLGGMFYSSQAMRFSLDDLADLAGHRTTREDGAAFPSAVRSYDFDEDRPIDTYIEGNQLELVEGGLDDDDDDGPQGPFPDDLI